MNQPNINKEAYLVKTFGYSSIILSAAFLLLFSANIYARLQHGAPNWSWLGGVGVYALLVGVGLVRLHRWAVVCFSLPLFTLGVVIPIAAVWHNGRLYTVPLALAFSLLFCWPAVSAIRAVRRIV